MDTRSRRWLGYVPIFDAKAGQTTTRVGVAGQFVLVCGLRIIVGTLGSVETPVNLIRFKLSLVVDNSL